MAEKSGRRALPWRYGLRQAAWVAVDAVFPPRCGGCGRAGERFCPACQAALVPLPAPWCPACGYPLPEGAAPCPACRQAPWPALGGIRSAAFFEGPLQQALHSLKYKRDVILADTLARPLCEAWRRYALPGDLVVPVPLSAERLRERGYNQADLLARGLAELAGLPYAPDGAARVRHTDSQVGLAAGARRRNVAGAFRGQARRVAGRQVILVDDVCTTGSTLAACAEALRAAGAVSVWGFTLARARRPSAVPRTAAPVPADARPVS